MFPSHDRGGVVSFNNGIELGSGLDGTAANTLDDYEEGTFTPVYKTTGNNLGSVTYDQQTGRYTKIGRICYFTLRLRTDSISDVGTGSVRIDGLPFVAVNAGAHRAVTNIFSANFTATNAPTQGLMVQNVNEVQLYQKDFNEDSNSFASSRLSTGANSNDVRMTGWYEVN